MRLLSLADDLRDAGLQVVEVNGWKTRGEPFATKPKVVVGHHTASAPGQNMPSLHILTAGRADLPGPLCQIGLSRRGVAYVVASGKANHAGPGQWRDITSSSLTCGIEAENSGVGEAWPATQLAAFDTCAAVLLTRLGSSADWYCGHREWALPTGRKIDPAGIDLDQQRGRIRRLMEDDMPLTDKDLARIREEVWSEPYGKEGITVKTALGRAEKRSGQIVDMVEALADGDVPGAKRIAAAVRKELSRALEA